MSHNVITLTPMLELIENPHASVTAVHGQTREQRRNTYDNASTCALTVRQLPQQYHASIITMSWSASQSDLHC
jgi:hypothetical protein